MAWHTTADARRDAERQQIARDSARLPSLHCSSFCAAAEPCAVTGTGQCDALKSPTPPGHGHERDGGNS